MTTFDQELSGHYVAAGGDRPSHHARRCCLSLVRPRRQRLYERARRRAQGHLEHLANDITQRSTVTPPTSTGQTP